MSFHRHNTCQTVNKRQCLYSLNKFLRNNNFSMNCEEILSFEDFILSYFQHWTLKHIVYLEQSNQWSGQPMSNSGHLNNMEDTCAHWLVFGLRNEWNPYRKPSIGTFFIEKMNETRQTYLTKWHGSPEYFTFISVEETWKLNRNLIDPMPNNRLQCIKAISKHPMI